MDERIKQVPEDMCCTETELGNLFPSYLKGRVTADERRRIEEHLARCEECRRELKFFAAAQKARAASTGK